VIKKAVVQSVDKTFMRKLALKSAACPSFQTFPIQYRKNSTTGKRNNKNKRKWFILLCSLQRRYMSKAAAKNSAMLKANVPRLPSK
jgi:hypothetical protein